MLKPKHSVRKIKPALHIQNRLSRCRRMMAQHKVPAYLITNRMDQIYLTGFVGEDGAVLITPKDVYVCTDGRFEGEARQQIPWAKVSMRMGSLEVDLAKVTAQAKIRRMCFQPDYLSYLMLGDVKKACKGAKLEPAPPIVNQMRICKDDVEIKSLEQAIRVAEGAFAAVRKQIRVGMTELEIAAKIEYEMKCRGAIEPSFRTIVAEGSNAAIAHAQPGTRKVGKNSLILVDWGARVDFYCSDLTRCWFMGTPHSTLLKLYEIVLEAQQRAIRAIAPGKRACDIDAVAREHIKAAGYGERFGHGLGHGLGLDIHESPRLKYGFNDILKPGMVVTVEPGIYLPNLGGIRIEDDVIITAHGCRVLTRAPRTLASAMLA